VDALELATGQRKKVLDAASFVRCTTDGRLLFLRTGVLYTAPFDAARLEITGEPAAVLPGVEGDATTGAGHFSISADQTLAYVPGLSASNQRRLAWADRNGTYTPVDIAPAVFNEPAVSPDGRRIAVIVGHERPRRCVDVRHRAQGVFAPHIRRARRNAVLVAGRAGGLLLDHRFTGTADRDPAQARGRER